MKTLFTEKKAALQQALNSIDIHPILGFELTPKNTTHLNLSVTNTKLAKVDLSNTTEFSAYITQLQGNFKVGIGGYDEHRMMYQRSTVFDDENESRCIHLGVDLWSTAYTQVYAPLKGTVHSFANNAAFGDYGATLILAHTIEQLTFYTLYGHLSLNSITNLQTGQVFNAGDTLCQFGEPHENGNWPPHLHFQLITDMLDKQGDFPGVASKTEREFYLNVCPNPNLILKTEGLI